MTDQSSICAKKQPATIKFKGWNVPLFFLLIFFLSSPRCFCICYCSFLMAFTSLSQALDLDLKEISCEKILFTSFCVLGDRKFSFSLLTLIFSTWGFFVPLIFYTRTLMEMRLCLEQCWEAVWPEAGLHSRDWSCLAQGWCASSTGALKTGSQFLSWTPWGGLAVAHRITSGLGFLFLCYLASCLWPHICCIVCKGESNEGSYWWAVFFANDCAVFAHSC